MCGGIRLATAEMNFGIMAKKFKLGFIGPQEMREQDAQGKGCRG